MSVVNESIPEQRKGIVNELSDSGKQTSKVPKAGNDSEKEHRLKGIIDAIRRETILEGVERLRELVMKYPDYAEPWGHLGYYLTLLGKPEDAVVCYKHLLSMRPDDSEAYRCLGNCLYTLNRLREARKAYLKLRGTPLCNLPEVLDRLGQTEPLARKILRSGIPALWMLRRRSFDLGFWKSLGSELAGIRRSIPGIRAAGVSRYLSYIGKHYFLEAAYRLPKTSCDLCGGTDFKAAFFYKEQKKVRCNGCGLEFVERRPIDGWDVVDGTYEKDETIEHFEETWCNPVVLELRMDRLKSMFQQIGVRFPLSGKRAFEIGCGEGRQLEYLAENGMEVEGTETSNRLVQYCRNAGLDVRRSTIRELEVVEGRYDLVMAYHVAEHLDRPSQLFEKSAKMLRKGGFLFVEAPVPDLAGLPISDRLNSRLGYANNVHVYYFRPDTLTRYFETHGFKVVSSMTYNDESLPSGGFLGQKE